jgi:hypothetical protein
MSVYDEVQKAIKLDIHPENKVISKEDLVQLPIGWQKMGLVYFTAVLALDGTIRQLYIEKGILKADAGSDDPITNEAIKWLTQQMAKVSSLSCMLVPGKRAFRRKEYNGWPCICGERFIVYANELSERERNEPEAEAV